MSDFAILLSSIAGVLLALGVIGRFSWRIVKGIRKAFHMIDTVETIVTRELEHNHGSSMKDDLYGMAVGFGLTQRQVDDLESVVYQLRAQLDRHLRTNRG